MRTKMAGNIAASGAGVEGPRDGTVIKRRRIAESNVDNMYMRCYKHAMI